MRLDTESGFYTGNKKNQLKSEKIFMESIYKQQRGKDTANPFLNQIERDVIRKL